MFNLNRIKLIEEQLGRINKRLAKVEKPFKFKVADEVKYNRPIPKKVGNEKAIDKDKWKHIANKAISWVAFVGTIVGICVGVHSLMKKDKPECKPKTMQSCQ